MTTPGAHWYHFLPRLITCDGMVPKRQSDSIDNRLSRVREEVINHSFGRNLSAQSGKSGKSPLIRKIDTTARLDLRERDVRFAGLIRQRQYFPLDLRTYTPRLTRHKLGEQRSLVMPHAGRREHPDAQSGSKSLSESTFGTNSSRDNRWTNRLVILIVILLALGPVMYLEGPAEVARWYQAVAMERWSAGEKQVALARLQDSLRWAPDQADALVCRGDWRLEDQEFQKALDDYNSALACNPTHIQALLNRSQAFQHLGLHKEAIRDWKKLVDIGRSAPEYQRALLLNGLAYAQALGNVELKEALENVIQAINLAGENSAMLDTRGYIHFRAGKFEAAEPDLNLAVAGMEREVKEEEQKRDYVDRQEFERKLKEIRKSLAVIRYHRALLLDAIGKPKAAESDRHRVRELGYTPAPSLF
jgi:tetratricopeptide (TPR) repeat protein